MSNRFESIRMFIKDYFLNFFWLGIVLLLISIIINIEYPSVNSNNYFLILAKFMEGLGIALIVASVFTFASSTIEFMEKIKGLLEDIILKRNFLSNLDPDSKKEALKLIIQPSNDERNKYPNIGDYYGYFIEKTLGVGRRSVRSNYNINSEAYYDDEKNKLVVHGIYSYRLFPSSEGYNHIIVGFEDKDSFCSYITVSDSEGKQIKFTMDKEDKEDKEDNKKFILEESNQGGDVTYQAIISIKEFGGSKNHLDVELNVTEYGNDHWNSIQFKALQPTDGFKFHLRCKGSVSVRDHAIFVVGAKYYLDISEDKKIFTVSCNQWINEGTGLNVLVSIPHEKNL